MGFSPLYVQSRHLQDTISLIFHTIYSLKSNFIIGSYEWQIDGKLKATLYEIN